MRERVEQLLGVIALAAIEGLRSGVREVSQLEEVEASAIVHLHAWPSESIGDLAKVVGRSQPATVRLVDRLVEAGLVARRSGPDRRTVALEVTDVGAQAAGEVLRARAGALAPLLAGLSKTERTMLEHLLERMTAGLAEDRRGAVHVCRLCDRVACAEPPGCPLNHTVP